jgi:AcrR family transcriptional regulator
MTKARLQQDRSRATRRAIVEAAESLWLEKGFDQVSVEDVCRMAEVAKGTFYFYFPRKEYLLVMTVFGRWMPRPAEVEELCAGDLGTLEILLELMASIAERTRKLDKAMVLRAVEESFQHYREIGKLEGGERYMRHTYAPVFARGVERGEIDKSWDVNILARTLAWSTIQEVFMWADGQTPDRAILANLRQRAELVATGGGQPRPAGPVTRLRSRRKT